MTTPSVAKNDNPAHQSDQKLRNKYSCRHVLGRIIHRIRLTDDAANGGSNPFMFRDNTARANDIGVYSGLDS